MSITDLAPVASSSSSSAAQPPTALACHPARPWLVAAFAAVGDDRPLPTASAAAAVTGPSPTQGPAAVSVGLRGPGALVCEVRVFDYSGLAADSEAARSQRTHRPLTRGRSAPAKHTF